MLKPLTRLQPSYYETFRCVGSACEDTCCHGWRIPVDKETYDKYQSCSHDVLGPKLRALVQIQSESESTESHAEIKLDRDACSFHSEGLCSIQTGLGEEYLSNNCATYPRVMNTVNGVLELSLDLSCPEAARLALANPEPMEFVERAGDAHGGRVGGIGIIDTTNPKYPGKPYSYVREIRTLMLSLLQNRGYSLSQRLVALGRLCDKLEAEGTDDGYRGLHRILQQPAAISPLVSLSPGARFETLIELVLSRIASDATGRRFLDCYRNFMAGLQWTMESTTHDLATRLDAAYRGPFAEFRERHGHVLEHYLVASAFTSLIPFGSESLNRKLAKHQFEHSIARQYQLMLVNYVLIETLLAGSAAFYGAAFGVADALKLIQSATKTFAHSLAYPGRAIKLLAEKGLTDCASMSMLLRD